MSALLWLFAHRISRLCSLIAVSELFDALPHVLQHLSSLMPSMYCNTQEEIPQSSHILQRLKGGPVHILSLMRGGERGIGPWRHPTLQMRGNYSNFTSMHSTGKMKAVTKRRTRDTSNPNCPARARARSPCALRFRFQKKCSLLTSNQVLASTGRSCSKKKVPFSKINISLLANFGCFFGKTDFWPKNTLRPNVKTVVSP